MGGGRRWVAVAIGVMVGCGAYEPWSPTTTTTATTSSDLSTGAASTGEASEGTTGAGSGTEASAGSGTEASASEASAGTIGGDPVCGDGVVGGAEACDDGNADDADGCLGTCQLAACGDGVVWAGVEACDDGDADDADGCRNTCELAKCGDGVVQVGVEACDDGNQIEGDACLPSCAPATCGDGVLWVGMEGCDDGNGVDDDACSDACVPATCGDGVVQAAIGEQCDDGDADDSDACRNSCELAKCGDGVVQVGVEECDDGVKNSDETGPCRTDCTPCACQGTDVVGTTCADLGFTCGKLACDGCGFDTSGCATVTPPSFDKKHVGPDFSGDGCWLQCEGYLDLAGGDDVPKLWGDGCAGAQFNKLRIACGTGPDKYRYVTLKKNVFKTGLVSSPELGLITEAKDHNKVDFATSNQVFATMNHPHNGASWWGSGVGCGELNTNLVVNNNCLWEAASCFGQNLNASRYLWVYVAP